MVLYTNTGLVKHAENALGQKTVYMWGGILRLVEKQYDLLYSIYGNKPGTGYTPERWAYLKTLFGKGYYGCDCVGLIKSYYWSGKPDGGTGSPDYGKNPKLYPDVNADTMYAAAKVKGKMAIMPETPGIILQRSASNPHVGIYVGSGYTIECTLGARGDGVVKRKLDKTWTRWFECPYIGYVDPPIRAGDKVTIKESATTYAGVSTKIPDSIKGDKHIYTVSRVLDDKALLKELYSWVWIRDLVKK